MQVEVYFSPCKLCAEYVKYGKVRNFEGHFAQSVESAQNGPKSSPLLDYFISSINMQSILRSDVSLESNSNEQH